MEGICYGLEGNSYMGKTTTVDLITSDHEAICNDRVTIGIPEYSTVSQIPIFRREDRADIETIVTFFLDLEKRRTDIAINAIATQDRDTIILFDRTPISLVLFEVGIRRTNQGRDATEELSTRFQRALEDEEIIVPTQVIHLVATPETFESRRESDLKKGRGDCIPFLLDHRTRTIFDEGTSLWSSTVGKQYYTQIRTDNIGELAVAQSVASILNSRITDSKPSVELTRFSKAVLALDIT